MELHSIQLLFRILHGCDRAYLGMGSYRKAFRCLGNVICMRHPDGRSFLPIMQQYRLFCIRMDFCMAIFRDRRCFDFTFEKICHQLGAIADAKHRNAKFKQLWIIGQRIFQVDTVWSAGQNDALRIHFLQLFQRCCIGMNLTVYVIFTDPAGNQLLILSAKVQYDNFFH